MKETEEGEEEFCKYTADVEYAKQYKRVFFTLQTDIVARLSVVILFSFLFKNILKSCKRHCSSLFTHKPNQEIHMKVTIFIKCTRQTIQRV